MSSVISNQSHLKGWCSHRVRVSLSARWKSNSNKIFPHHLLVFTCDNFWVLPLKPAELRDVFVGDVCGLGNGNWQHAGASWGGLQSSNADEVTIWSNNEEKRTLSSPSQRYVVIDL